MTKSLMTNDKIIQVVVLKYWFSGGLISELEKKIRLNDKSTYSSMIFHLPFSIITTT